MKPSASIITFFKTPGFDPTTMYQPLTVAELKEFKMACSEEEYLELARQAAEELGEKLEAV
jgi:hypothetical protein